MKLSSVCYPSVLILMVLSVAGCHSQPASEPGPANPTPALVSDAVPAFLKVERLAGDATLDVAATPGSLSRPAPNLSADHLAEHADGDSKFEIQFIPGPDATRVGRVGLGPVFNNTSCLNCHSRDGRGVLPVVPAGGQTKFGSNEALLIRISIEDANPVPEDAAHFYGAPTAVPGFTDQLFHRGIFGLRPDSPNTGQADIYLSYVESSFRYPSGAVTMLRKPRFQIQNAYDGTPSRLDGADVKQSPRLAPGMVGLGLLEMIPEAQLLALADPEDIDHDGISGRPNWVFDLRKQIGGDPHPVSMGRFGLKASTPSLRQQVVAALRNDMGITSNWIPTQSVVGTPLYDVFRQLLGSVFNQLPEIEANDEMVDRLTLYTQTLGVPKRRGLDDSQVTNGGVTFQRLNCVACHAPGPFTIGDDAPIAEFRGQKVMPFTDLLLHDMGDGLADGRQDFVATGNEWRTPPLWGLGVIRAVNPRSTMLHDGRARTLEEAILWHGGEAQTSRDGFARLSEQDRADLYSFLGSL